MEINTDNEGLTRLEAYEKMIQRYRSDERIKYAYDKYSGILHDKTCKCITSESYLLYDFLQEREEIEETELCNQCYMKVCVRYGAKDPEQMSNYLNFFKKTKAKDISIKHMFISQRMKTTFSMNSLVVKCDEDTWKMEITDNSGSIRLYHNNYSFGKGGIRHFQPGFHIQSDACYFMSFSSALKVISEYDANIHLKKNSASEDVKAITESTKTEKDNAISRTSQIELKNHFFTMIFRLGKRLQNFACERGKIKQDEIGEWKSIEEFGLPESGQRYSFLWIDGNNKLHVNSGKYVKKKKKFTECYILPQDVKTDKVIAWMKLG